MSGPNELAKAKLLVMAKVPYVQKERKAGLNYSFAGEAAIIEKLHPALREAGLTFCPTGCELLAQETYTTKSGASMNRVLVRGTYTLTHAASGQQEVIQTVGEGADSGDKATSKAMTSALKYALRQAFLIETGDDPDHTPSEQQERAGAGERPAPGEAERPTDAQVRELLKAKGWPWKECVAGINRGERANYPDSALPKDIAAGHLARFCGWLAQQPARQPAPAG